MTEFVSDILNYLQNNENAQGVVVALAAFGVPSRTSCTSCFEYGGSRWGRWQAELWRH